MKALLDRFPYSKPRRQFSPFIRQESVSVLICLHYKVFAGRCTTKDSSTYHLSPSLNIVARFVWLMGLIKSLHDLI